MATIYKFTVECVSPFCAYKSEIIAQAIADFLKHWDDGNHQKLESVRVKEASDG